MLIYSYIKDLLQIAWLLKQEKIDEKYGSEHNRNFEVANLVFAYSCKVLSAHKDFVSVKWLVNKLKWIGRNEHNFLAPFVPQRAIKA